MQMMIRETPVNRSYKAVNWAYKKSLMLEPAKHRTDRWCVACELPVKTAEMPTKVQVRGLRLQATAQHLRFAGSFADHDRRNAKVAPKG
ncbi:hypothetical protein HAX54_040343 [Datura stramonium]|uniref:Uncharacterized protein n=1 Tax=Datura stramonium TaxID=4076 RepID=A0ABS8VRF6_DATST|nr:hypothetical protein [Datura stramonium]